MQIDVVQVLPTPNLPMPIDFGASGRTWSWPWPQGPRRQRNKQKQKHEKYYENEISTNRHRFLTFWQPRENFMFSISHLALTDNAAFVLIDIPS
jgi:hypothetical protein